MRNILVTGAAGFIGTNLVEKLLEDKNNFIVGVDNLDPYYNISIKSNNLVSNNNSRFAVEILDITDEYMLRTRVFEKYEFDTVIHLAAQAGVFYSIQYPLKVINTNIKGFDILIRLSHEHSVKNFIYASSSSVLGDFDGVYRQKSPYAVTKATNELQGNMYAHLFKGMSIVGLRFYTVYGERMRPDLAIARFTKGIMKDEEIHVYGDGTISRDFTYVGDVVSNIIKVIGTDLSQCSGRVFDVGIGNGKAVKINELIEIIKEVCEKPNYDKVVYEPGKDYDAITTMSNISPSFRYFGFDGLRCNTTLKEGIKKYVEYLKENGAR